MAERRRRQPKRTKSQSQNRRLRKQPKLRRVQSATAVAMPHAVPKAARKRKSRNRRRAATPVIQLAKSIVFSARWASLLLLALCVSAIYLVGVEEEFYISTIPVEGTKSLMAGEIIEASGLTGNHIFAADPNLAAERVASLPGVISAAVTLSWPNEVLIEVVEETPIAIWQDKSLNYWVTEDGSLLPARGPVTSLLVIESEIETVATAVVEPAETEDGIQTAAPIAPSVTFVPEDVLTGALILRELRPNIDKLYYRPSGGLSYQDGRGWRVYFGDGTDMNQKLVIYETIVADLQARSITPSYVSVSNQYKPYYSVQ